MLAGFNNPRFPMPLNQRLVAALLIACCGAAVMVTIMLEGPIKLHLVLAATVGAAISGNLCGELFGRPGKRGAGMAAFGAVLATLLGAVFAGLLLSPAGGPIAVVAAPTFVAMSLLASPLVLLVWLVAMSGVHLAMCLLGRRREGLPQSRK